MIPSQTGYTTIKGVAPNGDLFMGTPNREVREMLEAERLKLITGSLHREDLKMFAQHLRDGEFEAARVVLERMIKTSPPEKQPQNEKDFTLVVCACTQLLPDMFLCSHADFYQKLDGVKQVGRPDVCMVFALSVAPHALVIELKFGKSGDSAAEGLKQIVEMQYVERSVQYMNALLQHRLSNQSLQPGNVPYLCFKLEEDKSVTLALPKVVALADVAPSTRPAVL